MIKRTALLLLSVCLNVSTNPGTLSLPLGMIATINAGSAALAASAYDAAAKLYTERKYREALPALLQVVKSEPRNSSAYLLLANCYYMLGDRATATRLYSNLTSSFAGTKVAQSAQQMLQQLSAGNKTASASKAASGPVSIETDGGSETTDNASNFTASDLKNLLFVVRPLRNHPAVSAGTQQAVSNAILRMPPRFLNLLKANGVTFYLTPSLFDKNPELTNTEGRGYHGATYKSCPGMFYRDQIVICERAMDESDETLTEKFPLQEILNTLYHECGHAIDRHNGYVTDTDEFKHIYRLDSAKIEPAAAKKLDYYLQKADGGPSEAFAQLVGIMLGAQEEDGQLMMSSFPDTANLLRKKLGL